jgi:hypothetical protein
MEADHGKEIQQETTSRKKSRPAEVVEISYKPQRTSSAKLARVRRSPLRQQLDKQRIVRVGERVRDALSKWLYACAIKRPGLHVQATVSRSPLTASDTP